MLDAQLGPRNLGFFVSSFALMSYCRRPDGVVGSKGSFLLMSPVEGETQDVGEQW